jgi:hypothetical protein
MFKRLFVAGTITFPLYFIVLLDSPANTSAFVKPQLTAKAAEVVNEIKEDLTDIKQEIRKFKYSSADAKSLVY